METTASTASAHTTGPWTVWDEQTELNFETNTGRPLIVAWNEQAEETIDVAEVSQDNGEWIMNARLIAAAPELLEHLKNIVEMAHSVSANWENGNLAYAVRSLDRIATAAEIALAQAHGNAA